MKHFYQLFISFLSLFVFSTNLSAQSLLINEIMSSNTLVVYDEDGETSDWLEVINNGDVDINLSDYYLSEKPDNLLKWQLPEFILEPKQSLLIFASGKDRAQVPLNWSTIIDIGKSWKYIVPTSEPLTAWKTFNFNETSWKTGASGIGYGDNDDNTQVPFGTKSVFMRVKFGLTDIDKIKSMWFHMDYDDGFVAYLNGTEISRAGMGAAGSGVTFDQTADSHDAKIHQGMDPDGFNISEFVYLLNENENVLAVQVHNTNASSSDFTAIPFLTVGYSGQVGMVNPVSEYVHLNDLNSHTNFKLSASGETLSLTYKDGTVIDSVSYGIIPGNFSFGRDINNIENWGYFSDPTPGLPNETEIASDIVKGEVKFSLSNMFVSPTTYLSLSGALAGEEIRFTENGNEPTIESSKFQYGILIDRNKVIRARIFKQGAIPGKTASRTYLVDKKPTLPVIAITTNPENLWDNETGIYVLGDSYENQNPYYGANFWEDWEKPAGVQMCSTDGKIVFALNCGIKIFGAWSRAHPQKSLSVFFRKEYGDPVLEDVQLFKAKPKLNSFKSFVLRNSGNDYGYTRFRDGMMTDLVKNMDTDIQAFEPVIMYLNGEYWGEINLREKVNEDYLENNHGVDSKEVDILEGNSVIVEGSNEDYTELLDFINTNNMVNNYNYEIVANQIDMSNYIDYELSQIYFNNRDWPGNNIKFWQPHAEDGKWRWIMFDTDFGFGIYGSEDYKLNTIQFALETNGPSWPNPPWSTLLFRKLMQNITFRNQFVNRFADMLNTTFVAENVIAKIDSIALIIQPEIQKHYLKWNTPSVGSWEFAVQNMKNFGANRVQYVQTHISQHLGNSGIFDLSLSVVPADGGSIKLNTIEVGGDLWQGKYFQKVPVKLTANPRNGYKFSRWEVNGVTVLENSIELNLTKATLVKAIYEDIEDDGNSIVINEINYNPPVEYDAGDWIELYNWGRIDLDISGWVFKDNDDFHQFVIPQNTILKSNDYLVICRNKEDFNIVHPDVMNILGDFDFGLGSAGDAVRLFDNTGLIVDSVTFGSEFPWPYDPNGNGPTLELDILYQGNSIAESWKSSKENLGTPGRKNSISTGVDWFVSNETEKELIIYPNPFNNETRLKIENSGFEPLQVQIFTIDGRMVCNEITTENEFVWRGENQTGQKLQAGIYICKVQSGNKLYSGKVILTN